MLFPVVWPTTLLVDYLIEEVRVGSEQRVDDAGEPLLWFTCQFNSVQDKLYTVIWYDRFFFFFFVFFF